MRIPSYGFTESFNVSVSVSLCLHHLTHKLRKSTINWQLTLDEQNNILLKWLRNSIKASKEIEEKYLSKNTKKTNV
jgi:tRNA (guanosine-2'-O-)-methyltransferase